MTDPEDTAASDHPNRLHADARESALRDILKVISASRAGDGIMVVFNEPVPCDDPAASRVALLMREHMVELCGKWRRLGHRIGFGVGISPGYATVGMVGFEGRSDYTASGTAVNLAARLCDQAADQEILLSQRAATALESIAEVESAGETTLKGFHAPVDVFRVTDMRGAW